VPSSTQIRDRSDLDIPSRPRGGSRRAAGPALSEVPSVLGRDDVSVWYSFTDDVAESDCGAAQDLLSDSERVRCRRLRFEEDRVSFIVAHALLRTALSRCAAAGPREWRFSTSGRGRPEIDGPPTRPRLRFNLSHTRGLVACAVTLERDVGIDVERIGRRARTGALAERHFSSSENRRLASLPSPGTRALFFSLWTLKEAYVKARGLGLAMPLDVVSFRVVPGAPPVASFGPGHDEDARAWQFALLEPRPGYRVAVAARREVGAEIDFAFFPMVLQPGDDSASSRMARPPTPGGFSHFMPAGDETAEAR
jgi:4'-phosphopantetheinyl transferase